MEAQWHSEDVGWDSARMIVTAKEAEEHTQRKRRRRFKGESCQVPFCSNPLELQYHKKYHVCREHFAAPCVALEGVNSRFCQKCGKFHCTDAFDAEKRTCRVALAQHNARRRKRDKAAAEEPPHGAAGGGGGSSSGATGSVGAPADGAARNGCSAAASGPSGSGATVLVPPPEVAASQPGAVPAALDGVPPSKRQQVVQQHQLPGQAQAAQPCSPSQPASPASRQAEERQPGRLMQAQAAVARVQPPAAAAPAKQEGEPAALAAQREAAMLSWRDAPAVKGAPAGNVAPPAPSRWEAAHSPLCATNRQGSGSASSSGAPLPAQPTGQTAAWLARQGQGSGLPLPFGLSRASLPATDLPLLVNSSGSMELMPPEALLLRPTFTHASAQTSGQAPLPAGSAAPRIEGHLFSMSCEGQLPASCFAEPHSLPYLQSPAGHLEQQQQQQYHHQQQYPQRQAVEGGGHLGGWAAASTNLPPEFQARSEAQPTPAALETQLHGAPGGVAERQALLGAPIPPAAGPYVSPAALHRISLKIFQCTPDQLAPGIRQELESVLGVAPAVLESYVRPGCTHLTVDMRLPAQQAAAVAAAHADAAALLAALRVPGLLGAAAGSAAALQWRGQLAAAVEGEHNAEGVPVAPPRLAVQPACIAVPPPGQPWPLVELRLQGSQAAGWDLARATVLARQSGRHLAVTMWGTDSNGAQAALQAAQACPPPFRQPGPPSATPEGSPRGGASSPGAAPRPPGAFSGEDDADSAFEEPGQGGPLPACLPGGTSGAAAAGLWVCPVGLQPGCCELEVEFAGVGVLPAGATGAAGGAPRALPLLSRAAPVLALRDAAAAAEVQRLVCDRGLEGREHMDSLLRDIGLAAAYLEDVQGQDGAAAPASSPLLPPAPVAAAAAAAAAFARRHGMPAVERLLRQAHAAAVDAAGGAQLAGGEASAPARLEEACAVPVASASGTALAADDVPSTLAGGPGADSEKALMPAGLSTGKSAGALGTAHEACWEAELAGAAKAPSKGAAPGGAGDDGLSYTALKVQAIMQDIEGLAAGKTLAGAATAGAAGACQLGGSASGTGQGPSRQALLRLGIGLAAFFFAVLLARLLPLAG